MSHDAPAYGLWTLVVLNSAIFIMFAFSFFKPKTPRDWRTFGAFAAFIVALFVEMYGFPLTIYLMSGWLQTRFPRLDLLSHDAGHLWSTLLGETGNPHFGVLHIASYVFLGFGFYLLSSAWNVLYQAQRRNTLAVAGPYARIRHPQYVAFVLILLGFLLQWPTLLTLLMFPILLVMYWRLAVAEETEMRTHFGMAYDAYVARTPRFVPSLGKLTLQTLKFDVHGMTCGGCTGSVERALSKIDGVGHVVVALSPGSATVEADTTRATPGQIEAAISSLGYQAKLHPAELRPTL